ncbi:MAG: 50S ribosomal protein L10 [Spirochaetaceae bacterium]|nr:MAG: 50S ribosomal protein L10 [Spirochaetaceae bacterium]
MTAHVTKVQPHKTEALEVLKETLSRNQEFIFTDYRGLTVEQITELRGRLRAQQADYKVVKNRYAKLAFEQLDKGAAAGVFVGPTAIALIKQDSAAAAKLLFDFAKDTPVQVKGAYVDGRFFDAAQTEALSKLPSRDQLIAQLMSTMNAPLQNLVYAMNGVTQKLVRVLQAVADKKAQE